MIRSGPDRPRYAPEDVTTWDREGIVLLREFFTPQECAAVCADFEIVFGGRSGAAEPLNRKKDAEIGRFNRAQFTGIEIVPVDCSPSLNLIGVHPALISFARAALRTDRVHLYQCQAWAKYTGDADYDQPFHCDFGNHTLTAPSEDPAANSLTVFSYFTDVTEAHGPTHYVTRTDSKKVAGPEASLNQDAKAQALLQEKLAPHNRSSAAPAGTAIAYTTDVYHRATNLTAPHGKRYALMACFKRAGDDSIGFTAWPFHHLKPWSIIFENATPEQLSCFGVQPPGDPFWTQTTLARAQTRYPGWDLEPYRAAARLS